MQNSRSRASAEAASEPVNLPLQKDNAYSIGGNLQEFHSLDTGGFRIPGGLDLSERSFPGYNPAQVSSTTLPQPSRSAAPHR